MEYENKLIKLLKLNVIRKNNILELYNERGMVGTIKEIVENNEKYYQTNINFKGFRFNHKRNINEKEYIYKFQVYDNEDRISIEMNLDSNPYIILYNEKLGVMELVINDKELSLIFRTKVSEGSVLENLKVRLDMQSDLLKYLGSYYCYMAEVEPNDKNKGSRKYELKAYANNSYDKVLVISNWPNHEAKSLVNGNIRDTIRHDEHGQDVMKRFRDFVNSLFPFNVDFLETFLEERGIRDDAFIGLYPDLNRFNNYYAIREINNNTLLGIKLGSEDILKSYGTIILNLKEICEFGYLRGSGDYSGSYIWNDDYIFRISKDEEVESVFDINNKKIINDINEMQKIYQEYKNSKVLTK